MKDVAGENLWAEADAWGTVDISFISTEISPKIHKSTKSPGVEIRVLNFYVRKHFFGVGRSDQKCAPSE